ncbi:hypothetical protein EVAR_56307_1 [Eumeta japonica]|uniref:Uncharacterized protein n=1 Tax=Eumeta variegata TaxID=151549 RepID=A0A4C1Z5A6_EUMVA|nr:hypothetical protein EVAR_56307_1 [Eumeta japonica]
MEQSDDTGTEMGHEIESENNIEIVISNGEKTDRAIAEPGLDSERNRRLEEVRKWDRTGTEIGIKRDSEFVTRIEIEM